MTVAADTVGPAVGFELAGEAVGREVGASATVGMGVAVTVGMGVAVAPLEFEPSIEIDGYSCAVAISASTSTPAGGTKAGAGE